MPEWKPAYQQPNTKIRVCEAVALITCPCGEEIYVDAENDPRECSCGRTYKASFDVEVCQP